MLRFLFLLCLVLPTFVSAATFNDLVTSLQAASGVLDAWAVNEPQPIAGSTALHLADVRYVQVLPTHVIDNKVRVVIKNYDVQGEEAYWVSGVPEPLRVATPIVYFSDRTVSSITAAQIKTYCNNKWETLHANTDNILDFQVTPVTGDTVLVSGVFDMGDNTWKQMSVYLTLVNPNAASPTADANVKFKIKVEN